MTQVRTFRLALATGLLGLTLAACGGGEDDATTADAIESAGRRVAEAVERLRPGGTR